jgi:aminobenzoyl-glutamate utilization protein A
VIHLEPAVVSAVGKRAILRRRDFHKYPELAWLEYRTASLVARHLRDCGFDLKLGQEVLRADARSGLPDQVELQHAYHKALEEGGDPEFLPLFKDGFTAVVGVLTGAQPGPTIAIRVDMDALPVPEAEVPGHAPHREGFRSCRNGVMHACGHDVHTAVGLGLAEVLAASREQLRGTVKLIFQPGEEGGRGAEPMVAAGVVDDVDCFIAMHIGLGLPSSTLYPVVEGWLASAKFDAHFQGQAAHAAFRPDEGKNALLAAAQAALGLHSISRHHAGSSRVNAGVLRAGTGRNVIADTALLQAEVRGANHEVQQFMENRSQEVIRGAAQLHGVDVEIKMVGRTTTAACDLPLAKHIAQAASRTEGLRVDLSPIIVGASEDATFFMRRVQERGGQATYVGFGTELAGGHHTPSFDIDEADIPKAIEALVRAVLELSHQVR